MDQDLSTIPEPFRQDVERAIVVLREHGAKEVYIFGSIARGGQRNEPHDIDIAVSGLAPRRFLHAYGILLGELEHRFDVVDLDADDRFTRTLRERGKLERVA